MSNLTTYQNAFRDLLMTAEGKASLSTSEALAAYLATTELSPDQQQDFLKQPLKRLQQYEYMVEANVKEVVENIYPFCQKVLGEAWDAVCKGYFCSCPTQTYQLIGCAEAFPGYLDSREDLLAEYPFLAELALYEWVEAELLSAEDVVYPESCQPVIPETIEALSQWSPVVNKTAFLMQLEYNIPQIIAQLNAGEVPASDTAKSLWILVYRQIEPPTCLYFQLTPVLAAWLALLEQFDTATSYVDTLAPVLTQLKEAGVIPSDEVFYESLLGMLPELLERQVLMGSVAI